MAPPRKKRSQLGKTARYYRDNPQARQVKKKKDTEVNGRPGQRRKRAELGRINTASDKRGVNRRGKDYDHAVGRHVPSKTNRGRNEKSRVKGSPRRTKR